MWSVCCRVITDMGNSGAEPFDGKAGPELTVEDSVRYQLKNIDGADLSKTGLFLPTPGSACRGKGAQHCGWHATDIARLGTFWWQPTF